MEEVEKLSRMLRAQRAAKYMTVMGLWRPPSGPDAPGPVPASTCPSCMKCEYWFWQKRAIYSVTILTLLLSNKTLLTSGQDVQIM